MNINISFKPDGTAQCLWTEVLPLHELGRLEIHRTTNIEFNHSTQQWGARPVESGNFLRSSKIQVLKVLAPNSVLQTECNRLGHRAALKEQLVGRCGNAAYSNPGARRIRLHLCLDWRERISRRQGKYPHDPLPFA